MGQLVTCFQGKLAEVTMISEKTEILLKLLYLFSKHDIYYIEASGSTFYEQTICFL